MKIFKWLITSIIIGSSHSLLNTTLFNGNWYQLWNNRYVQETNEIDWNCINVHIHNTHDIFHLEKDAILHNNKNITIKKNYIYKLNDDKFFPLLLESVINPVLEIKLLGPIYNNQYDYIVLTGADNLTMFTFTRDINIFNEKYLHDVSNALIKFNYTGYYKSPLISYTNFCLTL